MFKGLNTCAGEGICWVSAENLKSVLGTGLGLSSASTIILIDRLSSSCITLSLWLACSNILCRSSAERLGRFTGTGNLVWASKNSPSSASRGFSEGLDGCSCGKGTCGLSSANILCETSAERLGRFSCTGGLVWSSKNSLDSAS